MTDEPLTDALEIAEKFRPLAQREVEKPSIAAELKGGDVTVHILPLARFGHGDEQPSDWFWPQELVALCDYVLTEDNLGIISSRITQLDDDLTQARQRIEELEGKQTMRRSGAGS